MDFVESIYNGGGELEDYAKADRIIARVKPVLDFYASILVRYAPIMSEHWCISTDTSYVDLAQRLHQFGLFDAGSEIEPASTVEVLAWAAAENHKVTDILPYSINQGRADIAVACGVGTYNKSTQELALDYYRSELGKLGITKWLEAVKQDPDYCEQIDPILLWLPKLVSKPEQLAESASKVSMSGFDRIFRRFNPNKPLPADDYRYFVDWFTWVEGRAGKDIVLELASKLMGIKPDAVEYCQGVVRDSVLQPGTHWKQVLGIDEDYPDAKDIRVAYRKQASIHHPDKGGDTAMMQRINVAKTEALKVVT